MLQEAARLQNTLLEARPWPARACPKQVIFGNEETQVYFQLIQARQCRPWACSELGGRVCTLFLLPLSGWERVAAEYSPLPLQFQACY